MRFAFVTTEFPVSRPDSGGLASYSARMTRLLAEAGHQVDIFVPVEGGQAHLPPQMDWNGCRLHHIRTTRSVAARGVNRVLRLLGLGHLAMQRYWLARAEAVAKAVEHQHDSAPYDVVHSADSYGIGLSIAPHPGRLNVVRCSAPMDLYMACDGRTDRRSRAHAAREEAAVAAADFAFAPSHLTADHYSHKLGRKVAVLPTPIYLEPIYSKGAEPYGAVAGQISPSTPPRYLLHFANDLMPRKGTDLVMQALPLALQQAPDLTLLCVGRITPALHESLSRPLGPAMAQVRFLPRQNRAALYTLIRSAACSVLPSRIDNLPNTVLESLLLGTPVIGTRDSSIEELVEEGVTGVLVTNGSAPDLAEAMVRVWTGGLNLPPGLDWTETAIGHAFRPEVALAAYLAAITEARSAK